MPNRIKVEAFDELASIIDRVLTNPADIVFLEIPEDAYIAQNVLNFRLLKREADTVGKSVMIITDSVRIKTLASKASLRIREEAPLSKVDKDRPRERTSRINSRRMVTDIVAPSDILREDFVEERIEDIKTIPPAETKITTKKAPSKSVLGKIKKPPVPKVIKDNILQNLLQKEKQSVPKINTYAAADTPQEVSYYKKTHKSKKSRINFLDRLKAIFRLIKNNLKKSFVLFLSFLGFVIVGYLFIFVLPSATITVYPKNIQDTLSTAIVLDSSISTADLSDGVIPAQILEEKRENNFTFEATGEADVENRASGQIRVFNEFSSAPQTLVANTRFLSSKGKLFRTAQTVVVPGASISGGRIVPSSTVVDVIADSAGKDFNVDPTTFSIPGFKGTDKYLAFYGKSESPMEGGFKGVTTVVTQEDIDRAKQQITEEFLRDVERILREKIPEDLFLIEESFESEFETIEINADVFDAKEEFSIRVVAVARTFLAKETDILDAIDYYFINSTEYSRDYELSDTRDIVYNIKEIDYGKGYSNVTLDVAQIFNRRFDKDALYEEVRGKGEVGVRRILSSKDELERAKVRFWPFWVRTVPSDMDKIEIIVEHQRALDTE